MNRPDDVGCDAAPEVAEPLRACGGPLLYVTHDLEAEQEFVRVMNVIVERMASAFILKRGS